MDRSLIAAWLSLVWTRGVGRMTVNRLLSCFGTPEGVVAAGRERWQREMGGRPLGSSPERAQVEAEIDRLADLGGHIVIHGAKDYPAQLAAIPDPPPVLFTLGAHELLAGSNLLAMVGARKASVAGCRLASRWSGDLVRAGLVPVSGLAVGIDTAVHQGALAGAGMTVAVLATGLDVDYPAHHGDLKRRIAQQGCLATESPLGTPPMAGLFPLRNRLISGLSRGVVVVEASSRSGSLITARLALEQGREVFAVPGFVEDPHYDGCNQLLSEGATLVREVRDILESLAWQPGQEWLQTTFQDRGGEAVEAAVEAAVEVIGDSATVADLLAALVAGPQQADELARLTRLPVASLAGVLLRLELSGLVERRPGGVYALIGGRSKPWGS